MDYQEIYNRFKEITNYITVNNVTDNEIMEKYYILKNAMFSKNPLVRFSIPAKLDDIEKKLGLNNSYIKTLKK